MYATDSDEWQCVEAGLLQYPLVQDLGSSRFQVLVKQSFLEVVATYGTSNMVIVHC